MANLLENMMKDSVSINANNEELTEISKLANEQRDWEKRIQQLDYDLEQAKDALKQIQEFLLPEAMLNVGMSEFKLSDGSKITVKEDVYASIRKDFIGAAVDWLDANGLGDIVKDKVETSFGRGESDKAKTLLEYCRENGFNASENMSVHPSTLKATVKEQMAHGVEFPEEFFSIAPVRKAIIKSK